MLNRWYNGGYRHFFDLERTQMNVNIQNLVDDAYCYDTVREFCWPEGRMCPFCESRRVIRRGFANATNARIATSGLMISLVSSSLPITSLSNSRMPKLPKNSNLIAEMFKSCLLVSVHLVLLYAQ